MADAETIALYNARAADYGALVASDRASQSLRDFIALIPDGGRVLDLGCGPGGASLHMVKAGLRPDPVDAADGMVALARSRGLPARIGDFADLTAVAEYDGIWANFSLTHAPHDALPDHITAIFRALKPGGVFHIGMKTGTGDLRDDLGRFYSLIQPVDLTRLLTDAGFVILHQHHGREPGFAGTDDPYTILRAEVPHG